MNKNEELGDDLFDMPEIIDDEDVGQRRSYQSALDGISTINLNLFNEEASISRSEENTRKEETICKYIKQ